MTRSVFEYLSFQVASKRLPVIVPVLCMVLILLGASIPDDEMAFPVFRWLLLSPTLQNFLHIPVYGLLAFFWRWYLGAYLKANPAKALAFVVTVGFGVFQECYQHLIPGRFASFTDVVFDAVGAGLGLWFFNFMERRTLGRRRHHRGRC